MLGKEQVSGGFYIRGDRISARLRQDENLLTIYNDGTASLRIYDAYWVKDGEPAGRIESNGGREFGVVAAGEQTAIALSPQSTFDGTYSVRVNVGMILESEPVEYRYVRYFGDAEISEQDGKLVLTVDVNEDVTGQAVVEWFTENDWKETQLRTENLELKAGKQEIVFIDRAELELNSEEYAEFYQEFYQGLKEELKKAEEEGMLDELSEEEREQYKKLAEMDKEELYYQLTGSVPVETLFTAPLRIKIADEYIYVNVP